MERFIGCVSVFSMQNTEMVSWMFLSRVHNNIPNVHAFFFVRAATIIRHDDTWNKELGNFNNENV